MRGTVSFLVLALLLAGCADHSGSGDGQVATAPNREALPSSSSESRTATDQPIPEDSGRLETTGCQTWEASFDGPAAVYQGPEMPGWEKDILNMLLYTLSVCERVSWGPYERGPAYILFETQLTQLPPDSCREGDPDSWDVLVAAWFSDPELAAYAQATYKMESIHAGVDFSASPGLPAEPAVWTWGPPGSEPSRLTFAELEEDNTVERTDHFRFYWDNGEGASYMDLDLKRSGDIYHVPVVVGQFKDPTLAAESGLQAHLGLADVNYATAMSGQVKEFLDYECKQPA